MAKAPKSSKEPNMIFPRLARTVIAAVLFAVCGSISVYSSGYSEGGFTTIFMQGLFFAVTALLTFYIGGVRFIPGQAAIFIIFMLLIHVLVFLFVLVTYPFILITGMIASGFGALAAFVLANSYIRSFRFDSTTVFLCGVLAFILNEVFQATIGTEWIVHQEPKGKGMSGISHFSWVYFFWQTLTGIILYVHITRRPATPHE